MALKLADLECHGWFVGYLIGNWSDVLGAGSCGGQWHLWDLEDNRTVRWLEGVLGFEEADGGRNDTGIIGEAVFAATVLTSCLVVSRLHCSALGVCFVRKQQ